MAVPYYDLDKVKRDLNITDTGDDTRLADWNDEAENEIDDLVSLTATKMKRLTTLPVLPFTAGSVPESIQGAADNYVKMRYYQYKRNKDMIPVFEKSWKEKVTNYINRLKQDKQYYSRIVR
jgi:hypothetical protein